MQFKDLAKGAPFTSKKIDGTFRKLNSSRGVCADDPGSYFYFRGSETVFPVIESDAADPPVNNLAPLPARDGFPRTPVSCNLAANVSHVELRFSAAIESKRAHARRGTRRI